MSPSSYSMPQPATRTYTLADIVDGALQLIARTFDVRLSMLTRINGNASTVSGVFDRLAAVRQGTVFPLEDTFCLQTLRSGAACCPDTEHAEPAIRRIPGVLELDVRSYVGVPVRLDDGEIYGTLSAADSAPRDWTAEDVDTLGLLARLLSHEIEIDLQARRAERTGQQPGSAHPTDRLTGLIDRGAFENQLRVEERRLRRYGGVYSVALMELTGIGALEGDGKHVVVDQLRQGLANTLMLSSRLLDCCARIDRSRFAVLFPETPAHNVPIWQRRIEAAVETWNLLHPALSVRLQFAVGIADSEEADDYQTVLALAGSRLASNLQASYGRTGVAAR